MKTMKCSKKFYKANFKSLIDQTHKSQEAWIRSTLAKDYVCLKPMDGYRDMPVEEMVRIEDKAAGFRNKSSTCIEVLNVKVTMFIQLYYYFSRHYQIAVKIKPLYLTNNTRYLTSNTTRVVQL
jgi:hypothetical protein